MLCKIGFALAVLYISALVLLGTACFISGSWLLGALYLISAAITPLPSWSARKRVDAICDGLGIL